MNRWKGVNLKPRFHNVKITWLPQWWNLVTSNNDEMDLHYTSFIANKTTNSSLSFCKPSEARIFGNNKNLAILSCEKDNSSKRPLFQSFSDSFIHGVYGFSPLQLKQMMNPDYLWDDTRWWGVRDAIIDAATTLLKGNKQWELEREISQS